MADRINTLFARLRARRVPADFTDMQTALAVLDVTSADDALRAWRRMQLQVRRPVDGGHLFHTAVETEYMAVACRYTLDRAKEVAEHVRPRHLADGYDFAFVDGASFRDRLVVFVRGELAGATDAKYRTRYQDALRRLGATTGMGRRTRSHTRGAGLDDRDAAAAAAAAAMGADAQRAADAADRDAAQRAADEARRATREDRMYPDLPVTSTDAPPLGQEWRAIKRVPVMDSVVPWCSAPRNLARRLHRLWAAAVARVCEWYFEARDANDEDGVECALRWRAVLHLVLFRGGARGGEHARARREESFSRRTGLFFRGEYEELIRGYLAEREKRRPRHTPSGEDASIAEIEKLIACGNLSKAARRCVSTGLGDLEDPRVVAQLAAKHRARDGDIPEFDFTGITDYALELRPTYRLLPRGSGCGPDRFFNEYLILLTRGYDDAEAASAMLKVDKLESDVVNGKMPAWFYWLESAVRLVAPIKRAGTNGGAPDVRPLGLGNSRRRATAKHIAEFHKEDFAEILGQVQVAVGMKSGGQKLAFGVRAMTELNEHQGFVCAKVDKENAYNRVLRRRIMRTLVGLPLRFRKYARRAVPGHVLPAGVAGRPRGVGRRVL